MNLLDPKRLLIFPVPKPLTIFVKSPKALKVGNICHGEQREITMRIFTSPSGFMLKGYRKKELKPCTFTSV